MCEVIRGSYLLIDFDVNSSSAEDEKIMLVRYRRKHDWECRWATTERRCHLQIEAFTHPIEKCILIRMSTSAAKVLVDGGHDFHQIIMRDVSRTVGVVEASQRMKGFPIWNLSKALPSGRKDASVSLPSSKGTTN